MPTTYEINNVYDLLDVPPDRIDACLEELRTALAFIALTIAAGCPRPSGAFRWTDDGIRSVTLEDAATHEPLLAMKITKAPDA